jgi:serine/threonine protein kinase
VAAGRAMIEALSVHDPVRIGTYSLLGRLGSGAMGRVYLGRSTAGRLVAVKTIRAEFADEADFRARFGHEVEAAKKVSGAFTAAVVTADPDAPVPWLATTYVPAPSLDELVKVCGPLPVQAVRWLAAGCAEALESIHQAGLVHRDLKPSNVLVSLDGPRVIDFGVAWAVERVSLTTARQAVGTPAYMAPEQAKDNRLVTTAGDVFSLGSTLLFAATGHAPYHGDTITEILVRLATEEPDLSGLPAELSGLVRRCLNRDPAERPSLAQLLTELADSDHEFAIAPLPAEAIRLIEDYRRGIQPPSHAQRGAEDDAEGTLESGPYRSYEPPPEEPSSGGGDTEPRHWPAGPARPMRVAGFVVAAGVLVAGGWLMGGSGSGSGSPQPTVTQTVPAGPGGDPPGPVSGLGDTPGGTPRLVVNQPLGDGDTIFVVHGTGFKPGGRVKVWLVGRPVSPDRPTADRRGTFNYAVNQNHEFYPGRLPPGGHEVMAQAVSGGPKVSVAFQVNNL